MEEDDDDDDDDDDDVLKCGFRRKGHYHRNSGDYS
jgi:hypothetical protein